MQNTENTSDKKTFRIYARKIFLTYSQVDPEYKLNDVLEQLEYKVGRFSYIISKEAHKDGGVHFHVLLIRTKKFNIMSPYFFDLEINDKLIHGNYKPVNNLNATVHYACKDKQYITNLENLQEGHLLTAKEFIYQQVQLKGLDKALLEYSQTHKEKALAGVSLSALKKHFTDIKKFELSTKIDNIDTPFTLKDFKIDSPLQEWIKNPNKTLILAGKTGIGKTEFLKAVAKECFSKTLMVTHKEDLRRLDDTYDSIIIDDVNIAELEDTQLLSLLDNQANKSLRVLYDTVFKKKGLGQMIAMNKKELVKLFPRLREERMLRRVFFHHVERPFLVKGDLYINNQFNNVTNNNYNKESILQVQEKQQKHVQQTRERLEQYCSSDIE